MCEELTLAERMGAHAEALERVANAITDHCTDDMIFAMFGGCPSKLRDFAHWMYHAGYRGVGERVRRIADLVRKEG